MINNPYLLLKDSKAQINIDRYKINKYVISCDIPMYNDLHTALVLEQIAISNYLQKDKQPHCKTTIERLIFDMLCSKVARYKMELEYGVTKPYFTLLLLTFDSLKEVKGVGEVEQYFNTMFNFLFHEVINEELLEFITFLLPIETRIKYSTPVDLLIITNIILKYLYYKLTIQGEADTSFVHDEGFKLKYRINQVKDKIEFNEEQLEELSQVMEGIHMESKTDIKTPSITQGVVINDLKENKDMIIELTSIFRLMFESFNTIDSVEGELNLIKQQQAYLDSLTFSDNYNYFDIRKSYKIEFDFVLIRDISGSIGTDATHYYNTTLSILSSLEDFENVNTASICFNDSAAIDKDFNTKLIDSKLQRQTYGGTDMFQALKLLDKLDYKHKNKLIICITDGMTMRENDCKVEIEKYKQDINTMIKVLHVGTGQIGTIVDKVCSFEKLNNALYDIIVEYVQNAQVEVRMK
jgi:hypothetical protein